jgi:hypothetical protein
MLSATALTVALSAVMLSIIIMKVTMLTIVLLYHYAGDRYDECCNTECYN